VRPASFNSKDACAREFFIVGAIFGFRRDRLRLPLVKGAVAIGALGRRLSADALARLQERSRRYRFIIGAGFYGVDVAIGAFA